MLNVVKYNKGFVLPTDIKEEVFDDMLLLVETIKLMNRDNPKMAEQILGLSVINKVKEIDAKIKNATQKQ